jgi:hypothetical protein
MVVQHAQYFNQGGIFSLLQPNPTTTATVGWRCQLHGTALPSSSTDEDPTPERRHRNSELLEFQHLEGL